MDALLFNPTAVLFAGSFAGVAAVIAAVVGLAQSAGWTTLLRALEAGLLAFLGGLVARAFILSLFAVLPDTPEAGWLIGWAFFLWPGLVDTVAGLFGARLLTSPEQLLWIATGVGCFAGMMDGLWRIHRWKGIGALSFLLDVTWGLAGTTNACLLHLINFAWAGHADEPRCGAHRYRSGFRFKGDFAFTQGSVMSNNNRGPGTALYAHERVHVWQNRTFGPLFTLSYLGWMVLFFVPGLIVGAATGAGAGMGIERLCYFNNPWEAWAYRVGHHHGASARTSWGLLVWSDGLVLAASLLYFAAVAAAVFLVLFAF